MLNTTLMKYLKYLSSCSETYKIKLSFRLDNEFNIKCYYYISYIIYVSKLINLLLFIYYK